MEYTSSAMFKGTTAVVSSCIAERPNLMSKRHVQVKNGQEDKAISKRKCKLGHRVRLLANWE
jgi:hypothetical protein